MSASRFGRLQKATALVPLAVLSVAWTVNVTGLAKTSAAASDSPPPATLPDGTTVPSRPIGAPASVSGLGDSLTGGKRSDLLGNASASGIPAAALAAYQRAASVIDAADRGCHLPWQLLAAIGRVESDHGRADGNTLTSQGLSTPGIFGPVLDGHGIALIRDTDGGRYDGDTRFDRAVGPMQFIPSTWSIVGVDADGDGKRNPQDINDAALGTAVYLCAGTEDLSTTAGQRAAVFRYNHSASYVTTVLGVAAAYLAGDYTSVPNSTVTSDWVFQPKAPASTPSHGGHHQAASGTHVSAPGYHGSSPATGAAAPSTAPTTPSSPGAAGGGSGSTGGGASDSGTKDPVSSPTSAPPAPKNPVAPALATTAQLVDICTSALTDKYGAAPDKAVTACVDQLTGKTLPEAQAAVGGVVAGLKDLVDGLLGVLGGLSGGLLGKG